MQQRLIIEKRERRKADKKQLNDIRNNIQRIKLSEGCPHLCPYYYEDNKLKVFKIPKLTKKNVQILDMNFLWQPKILKRIEQLGKTGKSFEAVCGFDYRLMTQEIAFALKKANFKNIRIAWDWGLEHQYKIKDTINMFIKAGYNPKRIGVFILVNWKIPLKVCELKLDLLKIWNVGICDCCYDGGYNYAIPEYWTQYEIDYFRAKCALHNQAVRFNGIYPDLQRAMNLAKNYDHHP